MGTSCPCSQVLTTSVLPPLNSNLKDESNEIPDKEVALKHEEILIKLPLDQINSMFINEQNKNYSTLEEFVNFQKSEFDKNKFDNFSKAYFVYKWICTNIEYELHNGNNNGSINPKPEIIFSKKKTQIHGFAILFAAIIEKFNIPVKIIKGCVKGFDQESTIKPTWNIIYINGNGYLIETVWGSGNIVNGEWKKEFSDYYFCPNPEEFIFSHFPEVSEKENIKEYTLLPENNNICNSLEDFNNLAKIKRSFFLYNLKEIIPYKFNVEIDDLNRAQIIIKYNKFDESINLFCDTNKFDIKKTESRCSGEDIGENKIRFNISFKEKGKYELKLCISDEKQNKKILSVQNVIVKYDLYNIKLINPNNNEIFIGNYTDFKFEVNLKKSSDEYNSCVSEKFLNELYINTFGKNIKMERKKNIYTAGSLYVLNSEIQVCYYKKVTNSYDNILKLNAQNAGNKEELSYPECFELTDDMVLLEPLCEKLEADKKYNFKIKSNKIEKLIIINNDKVNEVNKSDNNIFEIKDLKVERGELKINYTKRGDGIYVLAYLYRVE